MIRILQVVSIMNAGGMENYIMNLYRQANREKVQFDFIVHHKARGVFDDEIEQMGGIIYRFSVLDDKNIIKYCAELDAFFQEHKEYRIIHGHLSSMAVFYLGMAKKNNVPWRIAHSHGAGFLHTPKGFAKYLLFRTTKWNANVRLACSTEAGRYLYGKDSFVFVPNGIDVERFTYRQEIREKIRVELQVGDRFVIGHVGRFNLQKNHKYLLRVFSSVVKERPDAVLLLLGNGELYQQIENLAGEMGIRSNVIFAGVHKDVENYYQAMDAFVLPSEFEGLPVTGIEAQYAGLPCFFSDRVTREVAITENVQFLEIGENGLHSWVQALSAAERCSDRTHVKLTTDIYNTDTTAKNMMERYQTLWGKTEC